MTTTTNATTLNDFDWSYRPLVVHAPSKTSQELGLQRRLLSGFCDELRERDIVVIEVVEGEASVVLGPETRLDAVALLERVGLASNQFGVAVVGKDAGVKLRSHDVVMPAQLFSLIDSMPMRRWEMKQRTTMGRRKKTS